MSAAVSLAVVGPVGFSGSAEFCASVLDFEFCVLSFDSLDIKNPSIGLIRGGLTFARPVSLPKWPHPLAGTTLPRFGRLARASALLLMQIQYKIFIDGSREPLSAVGGRPVHVINAVLRFRARKFRSSVFSEP